MSKNIDVSQKELSKEKKINWKLIGGVVGILLIVGLIVTAYLYLSTSFFEELLNVRNTDGNTDPNKPTLVIPDEDLDEDIVQEDPDIGVIEGDPAFNGANFSEELTDIETQPAYIATPLIIKEENPPSIIIYSHGSNTTIKRTMNDTFMDDMRLYGDFFTDKNFIFAASAQHGENWGSPDAVNDTLNLIRYINDNYSTSGEIYLIGYSMGGLPTLNFMFEHPENIVKTALLAPTSYSSNYTVDDFAAISEIEVKIWHGMADVNVPIALSQSLVRRANLYDTEIELEQLPGLGHWEVDTELIEEIGQFFSE